MVSLLWLEEGAFLEKVWIRREDAMDKNKYLSLEPTELYKILIADIMASPEEGDRLLEELVQTERYAEDPAFCATIDTARGIRFWGRAQYTKMINLCNDLLERTRELGLWQLLANNLNLLGNSYYVIGVFERAMEYYYRAIKVEEEHGLIAITSLAYNNIALIYNHLNEYNESYRYYKLAIEALEKGGTDQPRYYSKLVYCLGDMIMPMCYIDRLDEVPAVLERIEQVDTGLISPDAKYPYYLGKMYYFFYTGRYDEAKEIYYHAVAQLPECNVSTRVGILSDFLTSCQELEVPHEFFKEQVLEVEELEESIYAFANVNVFIFLREYYQRMGKKDLLEKTNRKYIELLEEHDEAIRQRKLNSLLVVEELVQDGGDLLVMESKNTELRVAAEEAIRNKNALQDAYYRIEMINELGQKITSSLDLDEVVDLIYRNLSENLPMHTFCLMRVDKEEGKLHSIVYYEDGKLLPNISQNLEDQKCIFVNAYKNNRTILSSNMYKDDRFLCETYLKKRNGEGARSIILLPLNVGNEVIGVLSIQHQQEGLYTEKDLKFLEELVPYLSIALNNAIRSWMLEREIRSHLETQVELRAANQQLSRLSSLDGLTQISNRRDFEFRIIDLLDAAKENHWPLSVFMFDIDNFKMYNDTYGHLEGDEALKKVAQVIRYNLDQADGISARFGGEEFIGACVGLDAKEIEQLAENIRRDVYELAIENRFAPLRQLSVSVGVAMVWPKESTQKSGIMRWADASLYQAKNTGKNKVVVKLVQEGEEPPISLEE